MGRPNYPEPRRGDGGNADAAPTGLMKILGAADLALKRQALRHRPSGPEPSAPTPSKLAPMRIAPPPRDAWMRSWGVIYSQRGARGGGAF